MSDLTARRRFYAEEIEAICHLRTPALVDALATVPRERFLPPGPWLVRGEGDVGGAPHATPDANPRHLYHNVAVAIDPARQLFNGAPSILASCIDALDLRPGNHVLHVGCGPGYYTAVIARCVGPAGRVVGIDVDPGLAAEARANLAADGVDVRIGDGVQLDDETFDAIFVNAGVTHPHQAWLRALRPGARLVVPLTCSLGPSPIGKGFVLLLTRGVAEGPLDARAITMVAIYSAIGIRDPAMNDRLGKAFMRGGPWPRIRHLRTDPHQPSSNCWLHADTFCLSAD